MNLTPGKVKQIRQLIVFTVLVAIIGINYQKIFLVFRWAIGVISPFLIGLALAFILNLPLRKIESCIRLKRESKWKRPVCLALTIACVFAVLILVMFVVLPEIFRTMWGLQDSIPAFLLKAEGQFEHLFVKYPDIITYINEIEINWEQVAEQTIGFLTNGASSLLVSTVSVAASVIGGAVTLGIGFMFSLYVLLQKEKLSAQMKLMIRAFLPEQIGEKILEVAALSANIFAGFLAGQCLEAVILGAMFFVVLTILRLPYALLIGVLIAFTALIPVFGSFVGCIIGTFLMLLSNPVHALTFVVIFFLLQQIEGNLIYPHVVGNSVGLPPIWVLVAVTLGGSIMGVAGMLIFIPLCSVFYTLIRNEMYHRLNKK